jgi:drug/metabolite transporter (DMT)-like permease
MTRTKAAWLLLFASALWGLAFFFQKRAMSHVGPFTFIGARAVVACLALAPLAWHEARRARREAQHAAAPGGPGLLRWSLAGGLAICVAAALQQSGLQTASVTNSGFLTALYVVLTPLIAWGASRKAPAGFVWLAVGLSALGTWLLGGGGFSSFSAGDAQVAASAFFWAAHVVITGHAARFERPLTFMLIGFALTAGLGSAAALAFEAPSLAGLAGAALDITYVGVMSSAVAFSLMILALGHLPPAEVAVIASTETVFSSAAAYLFLGERLPALGWAGASLIVLASVLVQVVPALLAGPARLAPPA